jgi:hypothetical protein
VNADQYFDENSETWTAISRDDAASDFTKFGEWTAYLPFVVAAYNASPIPGLDISPFELTFGRPYRLAADNALADPAVLTTGTTQNIYWVEKKQLLAELAARVRTMHSEVAAKNKLLHSMEHRFAEFKPSDLVIVRTPTREGKLAMQFIGPCVVLAKLSDVTYAVKDLRTSRTMRAHVQRLCRYHADSRYGPPYQIIGNDLLAEESKSQHSATPQEPDSQPGQGNLYWEDSQELKEAPFETNAMVILRSHITQRITIGKVVRSFVESMEIEVHIYMHDPDRDPRIKYDVNTPLWKRRLSPEYSFQQRGEWKCIATFHPMQGYEAETRIFSLANVDVLARDFELTPARSIPQAVLDNIRRQYDVV